MLVEFRLLIIEVSHQYLLKDDSVVELAFSSKRMLIRIHCSQVHFIHAESKRERLISSHLQLQVIMN